MIRTSVILVLLALGLTTAQVAQGSVYPPGPPYRSCPDTLTIFDTEQVDTTLAPCHPVVGDLVQGIRGIVIGFDRRPGAYATFLEAAGGGVFTAVQAFTGAANYNGPVPSSPSGGNLAIGDLIAVSGTMQEFPTTNGTTEIEGPDQNQSTDDIVIRRISTGNAVPMTILPSSSIHEINWVPASSNGEKYENGLVRLRGPLKVGRNAGTGIQSPNYLVTCNTCGSDSILVDALTLDPAAPGVAPSVGTVIDSIQGIVNQNTSSAGSGSINSYRVQTRSQADVFYLGPPSLSDAYSTANNKIRVVFDRNVDPATAQNAANYSLDSSIDGSVVNSAAMESNPGSVVILTVTSVLNTGDSETLHVQNVGAANCPGCLLSPAQSRSFPWGQSLPSITRGPEITGVVQGQPETFHVSASGIAPLTYQWRKEGLPLSGQTDSVFTIVAMSAADQGHYDVVVSNALGSATSDTFEVRMMQPEIAADFADDVVLPPGGPEPAPAPNGIGDLVPRLETSCITQYVPLPNDPIQYVCINFVICQKNDGTGNWQEDEGTLASFHALVDYVNNIYYAMYLCTQPTDDCGGDHTHTDTKIRFNLRNIFFMRDDVSRGSSSDAQLLNTLFQRHPDARQQLNVFFTEGSYGASGFARMPSTDLTYDQSLVLLRSWSTGEPQGYLPVNSAGTLAHELGHCLDLLHTYSGSCCPEACPPTLCDAITDIFCVSRPCYHQGYWDCDPNGLNNTCDNNMMGGTSQACYFTEDQLGKMHRALALKSIKRYVCPTGCGAAPGNLALWMPLNETSGPTTLNATGGQTGALAGSPSSVAEHVERSLCFNGTSDYVQVPSYQAIEGGGPDLTLAAWIKRGNGSTGRRAIVDKLTSGTNARGYGFYIEDGKLRLSLKGSAGTNTFNSAITIPIDAQWHHVAVTCHRSTLTEVSFFIDGVHTAEEFAPVSTSGSIYSTIPLRIGSDAAAVSHLFLGCIDEVEVYRRVLSLSEIWNIASAGASGQCLRYATLPAMTTFCASNATVTVPLRICNGGTQTESFDWTMSGDAIGGSCTAAGPTTFSPATGSPVLTRGTCSTTNIHITRPAGLNAAGKVSCYGVSVKRLGTTDVLEAHSRLIDRRDWCFQWPGDRTPLPMSGFSAANVSASLKLTDAVFAGVPLHYRYSVLGPDGTRDLTAVSLDNLPPGAFTTGTLTLSSVGDSAAVNVSPRFLEVDPLRTYTLLLEGDVGPGGAFEALGAVALENTIGPVDSTVSVPPPALRGTLHLLSAPQPNPANGSFSVTLSPATPGDVELGVYDLTGRRVARLFGGRSEGEARSFQWGPAGTIGREVAAGIYYVRATLRDDGGHVTTERRTVVLLK